MAAAIAGSTAYLFRYPFTTLWRNSSADDEIQTTKPVPHVRSNIIKIQRLGASLRGILDGDPHLNMVAPMAVAIGPYYHGLPELQEMEEAKQAAGGVFLP
ncbi:hypothetical protein PR202_gb25175 [Eleusine coracana subsp. coracana]|uniref:Uncharacterized protein n=1 Tax=Eleusine coracana subsp. coracana TaxID=191504 RepID=A0AAV5FMW0_ELECO|nr:hypothetical protein PR202_gb25175 [Eleusine coracana subsp. coracana]